MTPLLRDRATLRGRGAAGPPPVGPAEVVRVDPRDGVVGILRDAPLIVSFSNPLDASNLSETTFRVEVAGQAVPGRWKLSPDETVLIWTPASPMSPGVEHVIVASGLKDRRGLAVPPHKSRFIPGNLALGDLGE